METADSSPARTRVAPKEIAGFVNREIFEQLTAKSGNPQAKVVEPKMVRKVLSEAAAKDNRDDGFATLSSFLKGTIWVLYGEFSVSDESWHAVVKEVADIVANMTVEKFGGSVIAEFVNQEVLGQLLAKSADVQASVKPPEKIGEVLDKDEAKTQSDMGFANLRSRLEGAIRGFYKECSVTSAVAREVARSVANKTKEKFGTKCTPWYEMTIG